MNLSGLANGWKDIDQRFRREASKVIREEIDQTVENAERGDEALEKIREEYSIESDNADQLHNLRTTLLSAFEHNGPLVEDTEWSLQHTMFLRDQPAGPADLFVAESSDHATITVLSLVETKSAASCYNRVQNLCEYIENNSTSLGQDLDAGIDTGKVEGAIAISGVNGSSVVEEFDSDSNQDLPVSIWELESGDDETITVIENPDIDGWSWHIPYGTLGQILQSQPQIANDEHLSIYKFLDSHHERLLRHLPLYLHSRREDSDRPNVQFSKSELIGMLKTAKGAPNRSSAEPRAENLIEWWKHVEIARSVSNPQDYPEDAEVYTLGAAMPNNANITISNFIQNYRDKVCKSLLRKSLREDFLAEGPE